MTFEDLDDQTRVTMHMLFGSPADRDDVIRKYQADKGGVQTFQRLADHLAKTPYRKVLLERIFDAPRDLVFRMWTDPQHLAKWWGPKGFTNPVCRIDLRPGGAIFILMRSPEGIEHPMRGIFHEIVPPQRLVFNAIPTDAEGNVLAESMTVVTFAQEGSKTKLTVEATAVGLAPISSQMLAGMEVGWSTSLDRLEGEVRRNQPRMTRI